MDVDPIDALGPQCALVQATCGCEGVRRTARSATQHYERALGPSGLRATQFPILVALGSTGPVPLTRLAEGLGLDRTTLTRNLRSLAERSLVAFVDAQDARVHLVTLTGEGRAALQEALTLWGQAQASVEERFGRDRLRNLLAELSAYTEIVRD